MIVTWKRNPVRTGRNHGVFSPTKQGIPNNSGTKEKDGNHFSSLLTYEPDLTFRFEAGATHLPENTVGLFSKSPDTRVMYTHRKNGEAQKSSKQISLGPTVSQISEQKSSSMLTQSKSTKLNRDKKLTNSKGAKGLKRPNPSVENPLQLQRSWQTTHNLLI